MSSFTKSLEFNLDIEPVAKARPRVTSKGVAYTPKTTRDFEKAISSNVYWEILLRHKQFEKLLTPVSVKIIFYFTRPKSCPKDRIYPSVRPDLDNLVKGVVDALNGVVWNDDAQIVDLICSKRYREKPGIDILVFY